MAKRTRTSGLSTWGIVLQISGSKPKNRVDLFEPDNRTLARYTDAVAKMVSKNMTRAGTGERRLVKMKHRHQLVAGRCYSFGQERVRMV
jgi:hypothetical protein